MYNDDDKNFGKLFLQGNGTCRIDRLGSKYLCATAPSRGRTMREGMEGIEDAVQDRALELSESKNASSV